MEKFGVQLNLEAVRDAKAAWDKARRQFDADVDYVMTRLLHEAAVNYMSAEQVAKASGLTVKKVRALMRGVGLNPRNSKRLLAAAAADALRDNAALLGIEPHEMDLMSPLAYLPMGSELRERLTETKEPALTETYDVMALCSCPRTVAGEVPYPVPTCMVHGARVSGNDPVELTQDMIEAFKDAWHEADRQGREGQRVVAGLNAVLALVNR